MQRTVIVLGMHRSGTSCLTALLEGAGVVLGEVSRHNRYNLKGNRENSLILDLHDSLLGYNNGSWDCPPSLIAWPDYLKEERNRIIYSFRRSEIWGFKDPRTLLTLDGWLEALPEASFAGTFRHPLAVAWSLLQRNRFPLEKSLRLWKIYNLKLLSIADRFEFPIISFDLQPEEYRTRVFQMLDRLSLNKEIETLNYFDDALRHAPQSSGALPEDIAEVYERLNRKAI